MIEKNPITINGIMIKPVRNKGTRSYSINLQVSNGAEVLAGLYPSRKEVYKAMEGMLDLIAANTEEGPTRGPKSGDLIEVAGQTVMLL